MNTQHPEGEDGGEEALLRRRERALGPAYRLFYDEPVHLVRGDRCLFDVHGRSAEQRIAIDLLADPSVGIVSVGGPAGTGKSVMALAAGLDAVLEARSHKRVTVFRPIYPVGGQDLGFLPGTEAEKMGPWAAAVIDALESVMSHEVIDEVLDRELLEVLPLTHIRGRSLTDSFVVIEKWGSIEALKAHAAAPHMAAYAVKVKDLMASRIIHVLTPT